MIVDMRWTGDVYVMASGHCFRAQSVRGLLLGIDTRVALGQKDPIRTRRKELAADFFRVFTATDDENAGKCFNDTNSRDPVAGRPRR